MVVYIYKIISFNSYQCHFLEITYHSGICNDRLNYTNCDGDIHFVQILQQMIIDQLSGVTLCVKMTFSFSKIVQYQ